MKPLERSDILSLEDFRQARPSHERAVLTTKELRRIFLGDHITLLFENRETLRWQIHEMCRVEGLVSEDAVAHELETYNALLPSHGELSATLLIQYDDEDLRRHWLRALLGLQDCIFLEIEGAGDVMAHFDEEQFNTERLSSVQFIRFSLSPEQQDAFFDLRRQVSLSSRHQSYLTTTVLSGPSRGALAQDLSES